MGKHFFIVEVGILVIYFVSIKYKFCFKYSEI